jgi:sterol desaturase/sphingolipid hydroxylase (fatty acid hydroxylase superfamily)
MEREILGPAASDATILAAGGFLALIWLLESWAPYYAQFLGRPGSKLRHDGKNLVLGLVNSVISVVILVSLLGPVLAWTSSHGLGVLRLLSWPAWGETILAFVLLDLWIYIWHRANHSIPFLWRFHRMHHSETSLDATSGLRFHPGEIILSGLARLVVVPALGIGLPQLVLYETVLFFAVLFHHSNVSLPRWLDHGLLVVVVTPAMHRTHHSRWRPETDSNYGSVFSHWDRLLRSFRLRQDAREIRIGLSEFDEQKWQGIVGMLRTPLAPLVPSGETSSDTGQAPE